MQAQRVDGGVARTHSQPSIRMGGWSASHSGSFTPEKDLVSNVQEALWVLGPVWGRTKCFSVTGIRSPDRPARSYSIS